MRLLLAMAVLNNSLQCYIEYQSSRDVQNIVSGVRNNVQRKSKAVGSGNGGAGKNKGQNGGAAGLH